jgi:hypothetical protein
MSRRETVVFVLLSAALLVATLRWHMPMMLWDHIDLVPLLAAWRDGSLASSGFWDVHDGSHLHVAAYAVLLVTTTLSHGQPWLDCAVAFALLVVQAWLLVRLGRDDPDAGGGGAWRYLLLLLALHPGHLANLQWGWQVAVFISTLGAVAAIHLLTRSSLGMGRNLLALACAVAGVLGFSTTLAVFPVAVALVVLHPTVPRGRRLWLVLPWLVAFGALVGSLHAGRGGAPMPAIDPVALALYVLNYLGGGVSRLATALAPVWTCVALVSAIWIALRRWRPALRPWLALMLFGVGCAVMTAMGRVGEYGPDHAFATRYASFSLLFWSGWVGLVLAVRDDASPAWRRWLRPLSGALLVFVVANAIHMGKQAWATHARAEAYAAHIREHWPDVDPGVMEAAYGWRAGAAHARLAQLREWGYALFDGGSDPDATQERR